MTRPKYDIIIIGGGFFGSAIAAHLSQYNLNILILEAAADLMTRASCINQARIHTGFHYPRSFLTATRSLYNYLVFTKDFQPAIIDDYQMLYAIALRRSKVNARRFHSMFKSMNAPISLASENERSLFNFNNIEEVFRCTEFAFDYSIIRNILHNRLETGKVTVKLNSKVSHVSQTSNSTIHVHLEDGESIAAGHVFNSTYAQLNAILSASNLAPLNLKHELAEIALIEPPPEIEKHSITVMDGAFFSTMPFPSKGLHSLSHVRYTPHFGWTDQATELSAYDMLKQLPKQSLWRHMICDASRFLPCMREAQWKESLFEVKTVTAVNEENDGRPILFQNHENMPQFYSILGSKFDNIYDLYNVLSDTNLKIVKP